MKVKLVVSVIMVVLICTLLAGCADTFTYERILDAGGAFHVNYRLTYDASAADAETVRAQAVNAYESIMKNTGSTAHCEISDDGTGEVSLFVTYDSITDYYIAMGYTGNEKNEPSEMERHGSYNTYVSEIQSYLTAENIDSARALLDKEYQRSPVTTDFYYVYGTCYKSVHSNADEVRADDGVYYHTWKLNDGKVMTLYQNVPNIVFYYSIGIAVFAVLAAVSVTVAIKKNKRAKGADRSSGGDCAKE